MQLFLTYLLVVISAVTALPINKRLYRPSSPVFSVIAHHEGAVFQYYLLKWDGYDLVLNTDETAFFGRIKANNDYILNLPGSNKSANASQIEPHNTNVYVNPETYQLSTTESAVNASSGFGITHQKLTYQNSTGFLACPANNFRGEYYVHWGNNNQTECPNKARGYQIELIVQSDDTINYNPETNKLSNSSLPLIPKSKRFYFF
ncbi:hypothetical protein FT663_04841 [Candidozyma haemuli var. vulneris]|uniref:Uncharacterized protein n=1 Tax=Candidozyma haemuli TaxID=45357 RepID=A0A2V1AYW4_9ASCO|nr:hypothetical protein CXQ85_004740 [[Candida] haemuloni]KAF3985731.1 hypothetical protein FT662_04963 [[Candida] haemuloni var. vulneris]KAF3986531.1 hypothetical protein FT663_04841 [[Candida] haemuloni var. vulneris]PVH22071.1 hypothetical protein CXQ85_004740 [[Candida] haemuloni]